MVQTFKNTTKACKKVFANRGIWFMIWNIDRFVLIMVPTSNASSGTLQQIHEELYSKSLSERDSRMATINEWEDCVGVVVVVKVGIGTWETQVLSEDSWWHCFMLTCLCQRTQNCGSVFCVFAFVFQVLAIDCFGTNLTHAQTCDNVPVPSATPWTASVHAQHMPKPVITFVFKVLRNGLLRYKLDTWLFSTNSFQRLNTKNADSWRRLLVRRDVYVCIMIALYVFFFVFTHPCKKWQVSTQ